MREPLVVEKPISLLVNTAFYCITAIACTWMFTTCCNNNIPAMCRAWQADSYIGRDAPRGIK